MAHMDHARNPRPNGTAEQLTWRADGLMTEAVGQGKPTSPLRYSTLMTYLYDPAVPPGKITRWTNSSGPL